MSEDDAASAAELAYQHKGHAAAVFKPMFGQAHQQYLTATVAGRGDAADRRARLRLSHHAARRPAPR